MESQYNVKILYNKYHVTDDCFPIDFLSSIFIQGKNTNIILTH